MISQMITQVTLDPITESETILEYEADKGWNKISETTFRTVYQSKSPQYETEAVYLPSKEGKHEPD